MARATDLEKMSYAELMELESRVGRLIVQKREEERAAVKEKMAALARQHGFDIRELIGGRKGAKGSVAVKFRDPENPANTWTGRGRMPRWMASATKGGKIKKEDFLVD